MEIFKLLARSTGLQKSAPNIRRAPEYIPSAGELSNGGDADDRLKSEASAKAKSRGTKRKRVAVEEKEQAIPEELNFFGTQAAQHKSAKDKEDHESDDLGRTDERRKSVGSGGEVRTLSEEECRQIFKKHKLKITILDKEIDAGNESKSKKAKTTAQNPQRKKDLHRQLWPQPLTSFRDLRSKYAISSRLAENLDAQGYREPTEVQLGALPLLLGSDEDRGLVSPRSKASKKQRKSEVDLITVAPTGSGKTLAFLIPILQILIEDRHIAKADGDDKSREHHVQALIIAPTHELVDQIVNEARKLAVGTGIKIGGMQKGMKLHPALQHEVKDGGTEHNNEHLIKADVLVSTPLTMLHAISPTSDGPPQPLPSVRHLVLDEADVLLDPLFRDQTIGIWSALPSPHLRTTLWSATIGSSIETLAQSFMHSRRRQLKPPRKPSNHHILRLVVGLKDTALPHVHHQLTYCATEPGKLLALRQLLHPSHTPSTTSTHQTLRPPFLIFTQTIPRAIALHSELLYDIPPEAGGSTRLAVLHADLSPPARAAIMAGLRKGEIWIVITTDLLSRGVDIRGLNGVVNYDIPTTGSAYVHRVGRTGRQGRSGGVAFTLYTKEDIPYVKNIANVIAASERARGKSGAAADGSGGGDSGGSGGVGDWLLEALPKVSKKTRQELKRRGVESRRPAGVGGTGDGAGKAKGKGRISTKSGFERRMEGRRRGAVAGSQRRMEARRAEEAEAGGPDEGDEEWGGFDG